MAEQKYWNEPAKLVPLPEWAGKPPMNISVPYPQDGAGMRRYVERADQIPCSEPPPPPEPPMPGPAAPDAG
jgi:hypothetical protein